MDYTYQAGKTPFVCNKCGKSFGTEGGFVLHYRTHTADKRKAEAEAKAARDAHVKGCLHSFRLLSPKTMLEKKAIGAGYISVCTICGEVK